MRDASVEVGGSVVGRRLSGAHDVAAQSYNVTTVMLRP